MYIIQDRGKDRIEKKETYQKTYNKPNNYKTIKQTKLDTPECKSEDKRKM